MGSQGRGKVIKFGSSPGSPIFDATNLTLVGSCPLAWTTGDVLSSFSSLKFGKLNI